MKPPATRLLTWLSAALFASALGALLWTPTSKVRHEAVWGLADFSGLAEVHAFESDVALRDEDPRRDRARAGEELQGARTDAEGVATTQASARVEHWALVHKDAAQALARCAAPGDEVLGGKVGLATPRVRRDGDAWHVRPSGEAMWARGLWVGAGRAELRVQGAEAPWVAPRGLAPSWLLLSQRELSSWSADTVCAVRLDAGGDDLVPTVPRPVLRARNFPERAAPVLRTRALRQGWIALCVWLAGSAGAMAVVAETRARGLLSRAPLAVAAALMLVCAALALVIWKG